MLNEVSLEKSLVLTNNCEADVQKILIVEDENFNLQAILKMLELIKIPNLVVETATDGGQFKQKIDSMLQNRLPPYRLIFMDVGLPVMDGYCCV